MPFKFKLNQGVRLGDKIEHGQVVARSAFTDRRSPTYLIMYRHPIYGDTVMDWFGEHMLLPIQPPPARIDKRDEVEGPQP